METRTLVWAAGVAVVAVAAGLSWALFGNSSGGRAADRANVPVAHLPGNRVLVALKLWPQSMFDRRDGRLHQMLVIAYARRGDDRPSDRLGLFLTAIRDGFAERWRLLDATIEPYG